MLTTETHENRACDPDPVNSCSTSSYCSCPVAPGRQRQCDCPAERLVGSSNQPETVLLGMIQPRGHQAPCPSVNQSWTWTTCLHFLPLPTNEAVRLTLPSCANHTSAHNVPTANMEDVTVLQPATHTHTQTHTHTHTHVQPSPAGRAHASFMHLAELCKVADVRSE